MFSGSAELYDLIYSGFKDYPAEARELAALVRREHPGARTVLDVACGTGEHARLLADEHGFDVDGLDLEPAFVEIARRKLPRGAVHQGDMTSFALPRRYDVVLCLFSSIGYVRTLENVRRTLERFRAHLADGGIVLVEPWFAPGVLQPGRVYVHTAESPGVSVARMSHAEVEGRLSRLRFEYLIGRPSGIEHVVELHELGLFTTGEMLDCFRDAGLHATHDPKGLIGRGLFVARAGGASTRTSRVIRARPEELYDAFVDPVALVEWLPPAEMTGIVHELDARVGGGYRMSLFYPPTERTFRGKTAEREDMVAVRFVELEPSRRIVEAVNFVTTDPAFQGEMTQTVTFAEVPGGTEVTIEFTNLPPGLRPEDNDAGARLSLEQLARRFE